MSKLIQESERIQMSAVVVGELLYGFRNGSRFEKNRRDLASFLNEPVVDFLPVSLVTADRYSLVMLLLRRTGRPIPTNDVWIAAHAFETGAELVSFDHHFAEIEGLAWTNPAASSD